MTFAVSRSFSYCQTAVFRFFASAMLAALLFIPGLVTGCSSGDDVPLVRPPSGDDVEGRTVLVYMCAQNSLGADLRHRNDSAELADGREYLADEDRLLVYMDDGGKPRIYLYTRDGKQPRVVRRWTEDVCSTNPETFAEVLNWTRENYPSREYGLVMWSHADGWLPATDRNYARPYSFGIDTGASSMRGDKGPQMDVRDMARAIAASGIHFLYIFFDACLMQNIETCYALRGVTDYVIASPMSIPAAGAFYTHQMRNGLFSADPTDIVGTYWQDVTDEALWNDYDDYGIVISAVRTARLEELAALTAEVLPRSAAAREVWPDVGGVQYYQAYTSSYFYRPHNYDMRDAMRRLLPAGDYARMDRLLDEIIVRKEATNRFWIGPGYWTFATVDKEHYCGLSMFVPQEAYGVNSRFTPLGDLNEAFRQTEWYGAAGWEHTRWGQSQESTQDAP